MFFSWIAIPIAFENVPEYEFDPSDWTRETSGNRPLIQEDEEGCGPSDDELLDAALLQMMTTMKKAELLDVASNDDYHGVRFVNSSLIGETWAGMQVANLTELNISTLASLIRIQDKPEGSHAPFHDAKMAHYCPPGADKVQIPKYFHTNYKMLKNNGLANENNFEDGHFPDV